MPIYTHTVISFLLTLLSSEIYCCSPEGEIKFQIGEAVNSNCCFQTINIFCSLNCCKLREKKIQSLPHPLFENPSTPTCSLIFQLFEMKMR